MWTYGIERLGENPAIMWIEDNVTLVGQYNPISLRAMQRAIIKDQHRFRIVLGPRQLGMTTALICDALYKLVNESDIRIIYATCPDNMTSHAREVFARILYKLDMIAHIDSGRQLRLNNGSTIAFMTMELMGRGKGTAIKGVGVDHLYMDNASYVTDNSIEALLPSIMCRPNSTVLLGSTGEVRNGYYSEWSKRVTDDEFRYMNFTEGVTIYQ